MKSLFRIILFLAVLSSAGFIVSCEPDTTNETDPNDPRNEFIGYWHFTENGMLKNGKSVSQSYIVTISIDPDNSSQVLMNNFGNPGVSDRDIFGLVTSNQIVVSSQTLDNGWIVEGSGKKNSNGSMSWTYSITAGGDKIYYSATATKQ